MQLCQICFVPALTSDLQQKETDQVQTTSSFVHLCLPSVLTSIPAPVRISGIEPIIDNIELSVFTVGEGSVKHIIVITATFLGIASTTSLNGQGYRYAKKSSPSSSKSCKFSTLCIGGVQKMLKLIRYSLFCCMYKDTE